MKAVDVDLARLACSRGWISRGCLEQSLAQADRYLALGLEKSVGEVFIEQGSLTGEQVSSLRNALGLTFKQPRIGDYEVLRRIGIGGTGTVFEARHVRLKQRIALKILLPRLAKDPQSTERFLREARTFARLNHPHLVHALDVGYDGEHHYLAMEYVEGENLLQVLAREGPLSPPRTLEIARAVCQALEVLEKKGLVHRDVKPANILISCDGTVKLADFGLLTAVEQSSGEAAPLCGTPHYISPEQVIHKLNLDVRSDLYSLAASWYHILVGRPPFVGKTTKQILQGHLHKTPLAPSRLRPGVPPGVERILLRWLSKDRAERPASAREGLREIEAVAGSLRARAQLVSTRASYVSRKLWLLLPVSGLILVLVGALLLRPGSPRSESDPSRLSHSPPPTSVLPVSATDQPVPEEPSAEAAAPVSRSGIAAPRSAPGSESSRAEDVVVASERIADPPAKPVAPHLREWVDQVSSLASTRFRTLWERAAAPIRRFEPLHALGRSFHASFVALAPERDPPADIFLCYEFLESTELDDFRASAGAFAVRHGALRRLGEPASEVLDTIAWFVPPVRVGGHALTGGVLVVGMGPLRVVPRSGKNTQVWLEGEGSSQSPALVYPVSAGSWSVEFLGDEIEMIVGDRTFRLATPPRPRHAGRVALEVGPGVSIERVEIEGRLQPDWAAERLRLVSEGR